MIEFLKFFFSIYEMKTIHARIKEARLLKGLTQTQLGDAVGVTAQAVQQWEEEGGSLPRQKRIAAIAETLNVSSVWLQYGDTEKTNIGTLAESNVVMIRDGISIPKTHMEIAMHDINVSEGTGNATWTIRSNDEPLIFSKAWFDRRRLQPDNCKGIYVRGDSMLPDLKDWDAVVIDTNDISINDGEIYAVIYNDALFIKKIVRTDDGLELISSNQDYKPIYVNKQVSNKVTILGRMVWRGG